MKRISKLPFKGTAEQEQLLKAWLAENGKKPGATVPALQKAQEIYGYLPIEVQKMVAEGVGRPLEEVYGVSTFYAQFSLSPKGKYKIAVCLGTACYVKGSGKILAKLEELLGIKSGETTPDGKFTIQDTRCLGCCGLAPVMTVNEDVYGRLVPGNVKGILDKYRAL